MGLAAITVAVCSTGAMHDRRDSRSLAGRAVQLGAAAARPDAGHVKAALTGVVSCLRCDPHGAPEFPGEQLSADTPTGDAAGYPGLRRPGGAESTGRVLVEEHELRDADPETPRAASSRVPQLAYADAVTL